MKGKTGEIGRLGEEYAAKFLAEKGCTILCRNYHSRYGEIDLIARKDGVTMFVEVKTRSEGAIAAPREWVNAAKRRKIAKTALCYIAQEGKWPLMRFDVVEILLRRTNDFEVNSIQHIENAFEVKEDDLVF